MAQSPTSGYGSYVNYGFETTFGTGVVCGRTFGHGPKITASMKNNMERIWGLGARNATVNVAKKFEASLSVEFVLSHASFFRAVLGEVTDADIGGGLYTHTYEETDTIPSITVETGTELGTNDEVSTFKGCKINTITVTAAVGEVVKVRAELLSQTMTLATTPYAGQVVATEDPFVFSQGTLQLPSGATLANVQSIELTFNNSLELLWGLGSRIATASIEKMREYNFRCTMAFAQVTDLMTKFLGASGNPLAGTPAETATMILTFTNGGATTALRTLAFNLASVSLNADTLPKDVNEVIKEDVEGWARTGTSIVWTNATASDDDLP